MTIAQRLPQPDDTAGLLTLRDWLRYAVSLFRREKLFFGQGATTAFDEAVWLLQHTLHLPREGLETFLDARLLPGEIREVKKVLERRALGHEPAAYITGEAWLGEFSFRVDKRVIVPRSYFLEIIPEQLSQWVPGLEEVARAADVCTGSGCLAILLAHACPNAHIDATDNSSAALEVAALNVADYHLGERITLHHADVLVGVPDGTGYDVIVCNPPYEPESVLKTLPEEFRHEPQAALTSGADGLDVIRKLIPQAAERLAPNGILLIETGGLREALEKEFPALEIHWLPTLDETDCVALIQATSLKKRTPGKRPRKA
ncbi:MAG: 50S ribosomal protein L3 N(5)-glutamine methyltransferase [Puniceicoccales bacterium]|nr:50S ribosomal protein L3 N(5)-glutamine methyltransferase [Puniceicoccales bacterium]